MSLEGLETDLSFFYAASKRKCRIYNYLKEEKMFTKGIEKKAFKKLCKQKT